MGSDKPNVLMVGPQLTAPSGISAVVNRWIDAGLCERIDLRYIATLDERDERIPLTKLYSAARAHALFVLHSVFGAPDIVHIHLSSGASFYRKLLIHRWARLRRLTTIVHLHGSTFHRFYRSGTPLRARLVRSVFDGADAVIVLSKTWERFVREITANPNVRILYNGAAADAFEPRRGGGGQIVIASMGKLGDRKGTFDLMEAFRRVSRDVPEARLVLGGDGETAKARALAERHGLADKVTITGWVSGERKAAVFNRADVYALPSYDEGLPGSVLEAMAAGAPVVSTPVGGIPEAVIDGFNGFLVRPGDIEALHARLTELCRDAALRERMGRCGRKLIDEKFDVHQLVSQLTAIYRDARTEASARLPESA